jgi:hypothetical protein
MAYWPSQFRANRKTPGWSKAIDPKSNRRRLDDPRDFVRIEVGEALARGIPVVPVLMDGTAMPDIDELPDGLVWDTTHARTFLAATTSVSAQMWLTR